MIFGLILIALAVGLFFIARWSKGVSTRSSATPTPATPAPAPTAAVTAKAKTSQTWMKWIAAIIILFFIFVLIGYISEQKEASRKKSVVEQQTFQAGDKINTDFIPDHIGEWKVGRLKPGEYVYEVSGQYQKRWSDGEYSPIDPAVGLDENPDNRHPQIQSKIPFREKGYGIIFLRVGRHYVFPGEKFTISREMDVYAEPNIVRNSTWGNYENRGAVQITIGPVETKPDPS